MGIAKVPAILVAAILWGLLDSACATEQEPATTGQTPPPRKNKIEEFISRKGVVLVERMYSIKTFTWREGQEGRVALAVSAMHAYEADRKSQAVYAVRFEGQPFQGVSISALLDLPSAQALLSALEKMIAQAKENASTSPEFLEVKFSLGDSFQCGFDQQGTLQRPFLVLGGDISRTIRSHRLSDLEELKGAVALEIEKLKELGAN